jgi:prepilin-type N-terminal cleavage/methylation domain-containing protein
VAAVTSRQGTTLVELLVVLALVSIMIVAAAQLITHSVGLLGAAGRAVRNPIMVQVNERIRRDVQEGAGLTTVETTWTEDPLEIRTHDAKVIRYSVVDGNLVRTVIDGGGVSVEDRVLLRGVTSWWWRSTAPSVVDINIGHLVHPPPESISSRMVGYGQERRIDNLRFANRGGWGRAQW